MTLFSHSGLGKDGEHGNKIKHFVTAFADGYLGFEVDIEFFAGELILNHDPLEEGQNSSRCDRLEDLFARFGNDVFYWLDFKNLAEGNIENAMKELKRIIDEKAIRLDNLFFTPFELDLKKAKKIYTIIRDYFGKDVQINGVIEKISQENYVDFCEKMKFLGVCGLSVYHKNIDEEFCQVFADFKIFAWTVNDMEEFLRLENLGVENLTSDQSIEFFKKNGKKNPATSAWPSCST